MDTEAAVVSGGPARLRMPERWRGHAVCVLLLTAQGLAWTALHRTEAALRSASTNGPTSARIAALHVLLNRGEPDATRFGARFASALLTEPDPRLREFAFTNDVVKFTDAEIQKRFLHGFRSGDTGHWWRAHLIYDARVGMRHLTLQELAWWLDATHGRPLALTALRAHVEDGQRVARRRRRELGPDGP